MHLVIEAAPQLRAVNINNLALNTTLFYAVDLPYVALEVGVSAALFGASPPGTYTQLQDTVEFLVQIGRASCRERVCLYV